MGRPPKTSVEQQAASVNDFAPLLRQIAALRSDVRAIAAYVAERDQLKIVGFGERVARIAQEQ